MQERSAAQLEWRLVDAADAAQLAEAMATSGRAAAEVGTAARALSLEWRRGPAPDWSALRIYLLRRASDVVGLAVFSLSQKPLKFLLGEVSIAQARMTRHWHLGEPYFSASIGAEGAVAASRSLIAACLANLGASECLFFEGLPLTNPLHATLTGPAVENRERSFVHLELSEPYDHQFISMPDTFAEYIAQLGSRSRQSVLYSQRRLVRDMDGAVRCECFETEASVERFIEDAAAVSRKTYQWNLLGLGLRDKEALRKKFSFAARAGWWRSFILYCRDVPVAFMLGNQHGDCYFYDDVGYDPDFAKASVGSVLQIFVLEQLLARPDRPRTFDFSTGYGEHKGRFGNTSRRETNLLVMRGSVRNRVLVGAYRANERLAHAAVALVARLGLKERLKRLIRRRSAPATKPE